ncbi:hypothetical protein CC1G_08671 [Coprinopsis cinerea okayama7|uniref:Uncharacterized protein n=1 Tax=Coprinopsis cinerea (strain Okayama-7 / 130 / ATCC MYA-4618 / FGSC 9003) TaxID=240176 RepID=A8NZE3_COPC7|nr:hypothetical protein CC1G_08671 [Coprinopsis cinerea okayama7\|eukprot:XP_001837658.2 hypothetical protein CC1G_08671 [Coprinopsis cinerea okayama7\
MMNRIDVISWPHVLNSLGPALDTKGKGMFAPDLIQRAARRLEEIYGPPDFNDGPNLKKPTTIKTNPHFKSLLPPKLSLSKMLRNAQKDLFHVRPLTPGMIQRIEDKERRLNKAKRKRKQSRKLIEGTDSESDYAPPSKKRKKSASDTGSRRATSSIASRKATSSAGPRISTLSTESKKSSSSTRSVTSSTGSNEGAPSTPGAPSKGKGKATEDEPAGPRTRRQSTRNKP